jgi:hypothetical protein
VVYPCHNRCIAGGEVLEHVEKLAAVGPRARHLLAVNFGASRAAKLLKLGVKGLPIGADSGVAKTAVLRVSFSHILREA